MLELSDNIQILVGLGFGTVIGYIIGVTRITYKNNKQKMKEEIFRKEHARRSEIASAPMAYEQLQRFKQGRNYEFTGNPNRILGDLAMRETEREASMYTEPIGELPWDCTDGDCDE